MNAALIFAGGTGTRMRSGARPKQFLELYGKPIIIYTLEKFEFHDEVDEIAVVCLEGWIPRLKELIARYGLRKTRYVVPGGKTAQESVWRGMQELQKHCPDDTILLIHDGVRPLIDAETISEAIACTRTHGNAVTATPAIETVFLDSDTENGEVGTILDRSQCLMARAPQCFRLGELMACHERARAEGEKQFIDSCSMMKYFGHKIYTVVGNPENIKITTPTDYYMFRGIIDARENSQIFGL